MKLILITLVAVVVGMMALACTATPAESTPTLPPPNPELANSYFERAMSNTYLGKYELSIQDFDKAILINPIVESYLNRGHSYAFLENWDKCVEDTSSAINSLPNSDFRYQSRWVADAYTMRGYCYYESKEFESAVEVSRAERNCTSRAERNCTTERRGVSIKVPWSVRA